MDQIKIGKFIAEERKAKKYTQRELADKLSISDKTISKWERGQSYPDFQRLVMLSDYFDMTLDELVKDIDVQDVRDKNLTDEKVASIYLDVENVKNKSRKYVKIFCYIGVILLGIVILAFILHLFFPDIEWLWGSTQ